MGLWRSTSSRSSREEEVRTHTLNASRISGETLQSLDCVLSPHCRNISLWVCCSGLEDD